MAAHAGVKPTLQARSARTRDRILGVVERALDDGAADRLTVADIAARAGCSIGAFYGRFADKEAVLAALHEQRRDSFVKTFATMSEQAKNLDEWAAAAAALAFEHALAGRALIAAAALAAPPPATLYDAARVADPELVSLLARLLRERFGLALSPPDASGAAAFALALIGAMARDAAVYSAALLEPAKTRAWFLAEMARAAAAYLRSV